jgi:hypothetical protein
MIHNPTDVRRAALELRDELINFESSILTNDIRHIRWYFYSNGGDTKTDWVITNWSKLFNPRIKEYPELLCSHEEIELVEDGLCFTSTRRRDINTGLHGTIIRPSEYVVDKHPGNWYYYEVAIPAAWYDLLFVWMCKQAITNEGYDDRAILSFMLPFRVHNKAKLICSEAGHASVVEIRQTLSSIPCHVRFASVKPWEKLSVPSPIRESMYLFYDANLIPRRAKNDQQMYMSPI